MRRLLFAIGLWAAIAGCTQKVTPPAEPAAVEPAPTAAPTAASTEAEPQQSPATAEPAAGSAAAAPTASTTPAKPLAGHWKEGTNYVLLEPAQPTAVDPGQVEVIEFLWLGCPHCYELNPYIEAWKKKLPGYVHFRQEHVMWGAPQMAHATLFYTLEALGRDDLVAKAFDEIHRKGNNLVATSASATEQLQTAFAVANGISAADFKREVNGFTVATHLKQAKELMDRYRVDSVPTFIVNGKYRTDVATAGGLAELTQLLTDLAASEKAH